MSFVLTVLGTLLLLFFLAGLSLGVFMATDAKTRQLGWLFALWWVPGVAAATGVLMRDLVTFTVGTLCFMLAGVVFSIKAYTLKRTYSKRAGRTRYDISDGVRNARSREATSREKEMK